jgi:DNA-binding CsgD family transcriptional regulator
MTPEEPLGRAGELAMVDAFLERARAGLAALVLAGPAGIGKTTVWREGLRRAAARGFAVLPTRPAQPEWLLSFAGLADLLAAAGGEVLDALPPVQRHAIDVALLRAEAAPQPPDQRAVPAALLAVLTLLAERGPVLVAVDDAQWLDPETASALSFALRRVAEHLPVGVLTSVRVDGERAPTFESSMGLEHRREAGIGPLSPAAVHAIVKKRLGQAWPRPTLVRIVTSCGGNPFYALEIAQELERVGVPPPGEPLPVPAELQALVRSRMSRLPEPTREALLAAACLSQPTVAVLDVTALGPAEESAIVRVEPGGRVRFSHPLLAAAVRDSATTGQRQATHRRLARQVTDPEESARHLALGTAAPDEGVARRLAQAAAHASRRGAKAAAMDLARRALDFTVDRRSEQAMRRAMAFAEYCVWTCGDPAEARAVLEASLRVCRSGEMRMELRLWLAYVAREEGRLEEGYQDLLAALAETTDPHLAARIHVQAIYMAEWHPRRGLYHSAAMLELLDEATGADLYGGAIMLRAYYRLLAGQGADDAGLAHGREIEDRAVAAGLRERVHVWAMWPMLVDDLTRAVGTHLEYLEWGREVGERGLDLSMAMYLSELELWRGNWDRAQAWVAMLADMVDESGSGRFRPYLLCVQAMLNAHRGRLEQATADAAEALRILAAGNRAEEVWARQPLGFAALSRGDLAGAAGYLGPVPGIFEEMGAREPAHFRYEADLIEALIGLGETERAQTLIAALEERARALPRPWTLAVAARCRGLLRAATGDLGAAAAAMREALAQHENLEMPFERGRTLLACGQVLRRHNERRESRAVLGEALSVFTALGAPVWADRARHELNRIPSRRTQEGLTAAEEQIARLAAAGLTNRQIAERAYISLKTVEASLSRAYHKLGIQSRTQLAPAMLEREQGDQIHR